MYLFYLKFHLIIHLSKFDQTRPFVNPSQQNLIILVQRWPRMEYFTARILSFPSIMRQVWLLRTDEKFRFWIHADVGSKPHKRLSAYIGQGKATNTSLHATRHKHEGAYIEDTKDRPSQFLFAYVETVCKPVLKKVGSRMDGTGAALGRFHDESHLFSNACISKPSLSSQRNRHSFSEDWHR